MSCLDSLSGEKAEALMPAPAPTAPLPRIIIVSSEPPRARGLGSARQAVTGDPGGLTFVGEGHGDDSGDMDGDEAESSASR